MTEIKGKATEFLKKYGIWAEDICFEKELQAFIREMRDGLSGKKAVLVCFVPI